jgi:drug/metabolite transporter (DMT)-like permease
MMNVYLLLFILILSYSTTPFLRKNIIYDFTDDEFYIYNNFITLTVILIYSYILVSHRNCNLSSIISKVNRKNLGICLFTSIISIVGSVVLISLLKNNEISYITPHIQPGIIIVTLLFGVLFSNECINSSKLIGIFIVISGIYLVNFDKTTNIINKIK